MKKISISYNPYYVSTKILVDGKKPKLNSNLNFTDEELRLTEWADILPQILLNEYSDSNYEIEFIGSSDDFQELKAAFAKHSDKINAILHHIKVTPSIDVVEKKICDIYQEIKAGPIAELKNETIEKAFNNAQNKKLEIGIVAAMSSGKSTLINALLGKKIMPVANKATTSTIVKIVHCRRENYHAIAYDENHNVIAEYDDVSYQQMKDLNANDKVMEILIEGQIPCVASVGMDLVLVDTPGPNNSRNIRHKIITKNLLKDTNKNPSLVLFVQNATNLNTTDESGIFDFVSRSMSEGKKHSRDRYIFAVNKMDRLNPEDDSVEETLKEASEELEKRGILLPNIFPISAQVAYENRSKTEFPIDLPLFKNRCKTDNTIHFENYYDYSHLPLSVKRKLDDRLSIADETAKIDIHSGIVSVEEAIKLYVNKYARTIKVKDLVESFNRNLQELATFANLKKEIEKNETKRQKLQEQVNEIKKNIKSGKDALNFSKKLEKKDITSQVKQEVKKRFESASFDVSNLDIDGATDKVSKSSAGIQCSNLDNKISEIISSLLVDIETIVDDSFQNSLNEIKKDFTIYINKLNAGIDSTLFSIEEFNLPLDDIFDINQILSDNTKPVKETYYTNETRTRTIEGNRSQNASRGASYGGLFGMKLGTIVPGLGNIVGTIVGGAIGGALGYLTGEGDRKETYTEKVKKERTVEYVNMKSILNECKEATSQKIGNAQEQVLLYLDNQSSKLLQNIKSKVIKVNESIEEKANLLSTVLSQSITTDSTIHTQKKNLDWLLGMQNKVNDLVVF